MEQQEEEAAEEEVEVEVESVVSLDVALRRVEDAILECLFQLKGGGGGEAGAAVLLGRSLLRTPKLFMRTLRVLNLVHSLLTEDRMASQRDVYYQLAPYFGSAKECNSEIKFLARSLRLSRISLNLYAASRGFIVGQLQLLDETGQWIDLTSVGRDGRSISGDLADLARPIRGNKARFILVVEKEGIYQELSDARLYNQLPCIIVTAHGVPDVATRALVSRLSRELGIPVYCLADWNPGGVQVIYTYRFGSAGTNAKRSTAPEGSLYEIPNCFWLGMHWEDVAQLSPSQRVAMATADLARLNNLTLAPKARHLVALQEQLALMAMHAVRAELQALRDEGRTVTEHVIKRILQNKLVPL